MNFMDFPAIFQQFSSYLLGKPTNIIQHDRGLEESSGGRATSTRARWVSLRSPGFGVEWTRALMHLIAPTWCHDTPRDRDTWPVGPSTATGAIANCTMAIFAHFCTVIHCTNELNRWLSAGDFAFCHVLHRIEAGALWHLAMMGTLSILTAMSEL